MVGITRAGALLLDDGYLHSYGLANHQRVSAFGLADSRDLNRRARRTGGFQRQLNLSFQLRRRRSCYGALADHRFVVCSRSDDKATGRR